MATDIKKSPVKDVRVNLGKMADQFTLALPKHMDAQKFLRCVYTQIQQNQRLQQCSQDSLLAASMRLAERGLYPDGHNAYLIPRYNKKAGGYEVSGEAGYRGLMNLARRSGEIADIFAATIRERDEWDYELGFHRNLKHKPALGDRGAPIAYYAVVEYKDGTKTFGPGPITHQEMMDHEKKYAPDGFSPWKTNFEAMAWKTAVKRVLNWVPQSAELQRAMQEEAEDVPPMQVSVSAPTSRSEEVLKQIEFDKETGEITSPVEEGNDPDWAEPKGKKLNPKDEREKQEKVIDETLPEKGSDEAPWED